MNEPREIPGPIEKPVRSTPLSALFLLVAVCAVLVGMVVPGIAAIQESTVGAGESIARLLLGFLGGSVVGLLIGLCFEDRVAASLIGSLTGAGAGFLATLMTLTETKMTSQVLLTSLIGTVVVLACALALRQRSRHESRD